MKKNIIALVVGTLASGAALAQSNVTVYGIMDMGYQYSWDNPVKGTSNSFSQMKSGGQDSSRFGFKGSEDLGNGLKVNFDTAADFNTDIGGTLVGMNEVSWVGMSGVNWGEFKAGYTNTFLDENTGIDVSGRHGIASTGALYGTGKYSNFVAYYSPVFSGLQVKAGFSSNTGDQDQVPSSSSTQFNVRAYTAAVSYTNGKLKLGAAYAAYEPQDVHNNPTPTQSGYDWNAGVAYDFGVAAVSLFGAQPKNGTPSTPPGSASAYPDGAPLSVDRRKFLALGLAVPFGEKDIVKLGYGEARSHLSASDETDHSHAYGIVYLHNLSKRTNTYMMYGNVGSDTDLYSTGSGYQQAINVGLRHLF